MGNQLIKNTQIDKDPIGSAGTNGQWKIYSGNRLDKNKQQVTIFMFDKKVVAKYSQTGKDDFLNVLRKEANSLAKFKHPGVLSILDLLIEDQKQMGFVTESVQGSLLSLIESNKVQDIFPSELETKFHLLELIDALQFLHNDAKTCHLSLSPEHIYISSEGKWKIGGLTFSAQVMQGGSIQSGIEFTTVSGDPKLTPSLKFTAPEVIDNNSNCSLAADIFSLGCLIYTIFKISSDKSCKSPYLINPTNLNGYKEAIKSIDRQDFSCIPQSLRSIIQRMVNPDQNMRVSINDFANHGYFKDPFIQTVRHLESLYQKEFTQQQNFLKGLAKIISKFDVKFTKSKIVPMLTNLIKNEQLASSILPIFFQLMSAPDFMTKVEFNDLIWPSLKALATGRDIPAQALYLLIDNTDKLIENIDIKDFQTVFIPLFGKSFECGVQKIQIMALKKIEIVFTKIDYNVLKSQIIPRILLLCTDPNIDVRKDAIFLISKNLSVFDKNLVNDQILSTLEKARKLVNNYKINMTILQMFEAVSKNLSVDIIANKVLISMIPSLVDSKLSKPEYRAYLSTVKTLVQRIEEEQEKNFQGSSDNPPEDIDDEKKQQTPTQVFEKSSGDFDFLESFGGTTSSSPEINFSGFEKQNSGGSNSFGFDSGSTNQFDNDPFGSAFGKKPQDNSFGKSTSGQLDPFSDFGAKTNSFNTTNQQTTTSTNQFSNKSLTEKPNPIKKLGNPFTSSGPDAQKQASTSFDPFQFSNTEQPKVSTNNSSGLTNVNFGSYSNSFGSNNNSNTKQKSAWDIDIDSELDIGKNTNPFGSGTNTFTNQNSNTFSNNQSSNNFSNFQFNNSQSSNVSKSSNPWDNLDDEVNKPSLIQQTSNQGFGQMNTQNDFGRNDSNFQNNFGMGNSFNNKPTGNTGGMVINQGAKNNPFAVKEDDFLAGIQGNKPKNNSFNFIAKPQSFNGNGNDLI